MTFGFKNLDLIKMPKRLLIIVGGGIVVLAAGYFISLKEANKIMAAQEGEIASFSQTQQKLYEQKLQSKPATPKQLAQMGQNFIKQNQPDFAIIVLSRAVQQSPKYRDGWIYLGYAYLQKKDTAAAEKALEKARDLDPIYGYTWELLAKCKEMEGDTQTAQQWYNKSKQLSQGQ